MKDMPKTVTVNGEKHVLVGDALTWEELMLLAGLAEETVASVTYKGPGVRGILEPRQPLGLVDGLIVNAYVTGSA